MKVFAFFHRFALATFIGIQASMMLATSASGAVYTYDFDGDSSNDVTNGSGGTWSAGGSALWFTSTVTPDVAWTNNTTTPDSAIFGTGATAAGTLLAIKTAGDIYVNSLTFNSANAGGSYSLGLDGTGAGHIRFAGDTPTVTTNALADIYTRMSATSFTKAGSGTLIIRNNNNSLGTLSIQAGTLDIYQVLTTTSVEVLGTAKWDTHSGDNWTMGAVTYSSSQTSNLNSFGSNSTYTASSLTINSGIINVTAGDGAASSVSSTFTINGLVTINGGSISLTSSNASATPNSTARLVLNGNVLVTANSTISNSGNATELLDLGAGVRTFTVNGTAVTYNLNAVTTNGGIIKAGDGILSIGGTESNTYTGTTTLNAGILKLAKTNGLDAIAGDVLINSGTFDWDQSNQIKDTASITLGGSGFLKLDGFTETIANLNITGNGNVNLDGGTNNGFMTITGTLTADAVGGTNGGRSINLNSGSQWSAGTVNFISGYTGSGAAIGLNGNSTRMTLFTVGTGGITLTGQTINLEKAGTGNTGSELALNGNLTASGTNLIRFSDATKTAGVSNVNLRAGIRTWNIISGTTTVNSTIVSQNDVATTSATPVARTNVVGGIEKTGTGTLVLNNTNTYIGSTTITAGTLKLSTFTYSVSGSPVLTITGSIDTTPLITVGTAGTFDVRDITGYSVKASQTLQGGGSILGAVTIANGAFLSGGTTGGDITQTLSFSAGLTLANGSTTYLDLVSPADSDRLNVTGSLSQADGAKIIVSPGGYTGTFAVQTFDLLDWTTSFTASSNLGASYRTGLGDESFDLDLPDISASAYIWDISDFTSSGVIRMVVAPEPNRMILLGLGLGVTIMRRRRKIV